MGKVTVGIPVWNEGRFLDQTLASLVQSQNYDYIDRIIVSDNASTDNTNEIATAYAVKYPKIEVQRLEKTVSARDNSMRLINQASTEYFMLLGGHDIISDNYFSELLPKLQARPEAVAAFPMIYSFVASPAKDNVMLDVRISTIDSDDVQKRIYAVLHQDQHCCAINQLVRASIYKKTMSRIQPNEISGDTIIAMHTALLGPCVTSSEAAYYYRATNTGESYKGTIRRYVMQHQTRVPLINRVGYIPKKYWSLCNEYEPHLCNKQLEKDIIHSVETDPNCNADLYDEDWLARCKGYGELFKYLDRADKPIALLGVGIDGYEARRFAEYGNKLHFTAYVRSGDEAVHEAFANDKVESMDFLRGKQDEWIVIVADEFHEDERMQQLAGMGYEEHSTCFSMWDMIYPETIVVKKKIVTKKDRIRAAWHKYNALQFAIKAVAKVLGKIASVLDKMATPSVYRKA